VADRSLSATLGTRLTVRYRLTPWWVKVIVVFVASRIITTSILLAFASIQQANPWTGAKPGYADFATIWDGHWYYIIAAVGYPTELPMTAEGQVGESAWAFMPAYPALVRLLMAVTGLDFPVLAVAVSVACALGAALLFYRVMALVLPGETALFSVVLFCVAPLSPVLQVSYAESLGILLLTFALYLLLTRRYWSMIPVVAVMALTRPSGLAFALLMVLHVGQRWWASRPARAEPADFPVADRVAASTVAVFSGLMGIAWIVVAWALTGDLHAYTSTELAWRSAYIGYQELVPFTPWLWGSQWWSAWLGIPLPLGLGLLAVVVAGFFGALFLPQVKRLGVDLRFWLASYALYLLAVFFPQSSTFRLLMPLFPALGALAQPRSIAYRVGVVLLFIAGQVAWVWACWWVDGSDWSPP